MSFLLLSGVTGKVQRLSGWSCQHKVIFYTQGVHRQTVTFKMLYKILPGDANSFLMLAGTVKEGKLFSSH